MLQKNLSYPSIDIGDICYHTYGSDRKKLPMCTQHIWISNHIQKHIQSSIIRHSISQIRLLSKIKKCLDANHSPGFVISCRGQVDRVHHFSFHFYVSMTRI